VFLAMPQQICELLLMKQVMPLLNPSQTRVMLFLTPLPCHYPWLWLFYFPFLCCHILDWIFFNKFLDRSLVEGDNTFDLVIQYFSKKESDHYNPISDIIFFHLHTGLDIKYIVKNDTTFIFSHVQSDNTFGLVRQLCYICLGELLLLSIIFHFTMQLFCITKLNSFTSNQIIFFN